MRKLSLQLAKPSTHLPTSNGLLQKLNIIWWPENLKSMSIHCLQVNAVLISLWHGLYHFQILKDKHINVIKEFGRTWHVLSDSGQSEPPSSSELPQDQWFRSRFSPVHGHINGRPHSLYLVSYRSGKSWKWSPHDEVFFLRIAWKQHSNVKNPSERSIVLRQRYSKVHVNGFLFFYGPYCVSTLAEPGCHYITRRVFGGTPEDLPCAFCSSPFPKAPPGYSKTLSGSRLAERAPENFAWGVRQAGTRTSSGLSIIT